MDCLLDGETRVTDRFPNVRVHVVDDRKLGSATAPGDQLLQRKRITLHVDRDAAVRLVAGVAAQAEPLGFPARGTAEIDALHLAGHADHAPLDGHAFWSDRSRSLQKYEQPSGPITAACSIPPGMVSSSPGRQRRPVPASVTSISPASTTIILVSAWW